MLTQQNAPVSSVLEARSFAFGDLAITFESEDGAWLGYLGERYPRFGLDASESSFRARFEPTGPTPSTLVSPLEARLENVTIEPTPAGFELVTPTSHAVVDLQARRAMLRGPRAMYPLDNLLRHLLPVLWGEGALFHGAALAAGANGLLACGPSGAGKSTLARLAAGHALCDELAGVRPYDDGRRCGHHLLSLPFWASRPGNARLSALLLLEHGKEHRLTRLTPGEALRGLASLLLWPTASATSMANALTHLSHLVSSVPAFRLSFAPREDVWPFLVKELL